ncbi:thioredoxin reductase [Labrys miyagiensis]|uniref:Thioredoxin reductase n=1 Tax=Labrys miyagiensis TaxID=346912 RepID=A0ABQ6CLH9_9HYPH|nr:cyclic nucleotide-binding domain-containing thioredoxin-disulfide reductase [Labrys miyagiensis]GLS21206.1 thioredoxin reductase [Labrys miyagiensis]
MTTPSIGSAASNARFEQMFPTLTSVEIARMGKFGEPRRYRDRERIVESGKPGAGMIVVLSGHVAITQRDGLGHVSPVVEYGPGQFLGEVGQLSGRASFVDAHAEGEVEAIVIAPARLRRLLTAEADLGERIMRALILRRVGLIQSGVGGPLLVGSLHMPDVMRLQSFLTRNAYPYHLLDPTVDAEAAGLVAAAPTALKGLPWVVMSDGTTLHNPTEAELARAMGMLAERPASALYDVAIVGAGPAGLATAVYACSEGLSAVVLDARAFGGQAGASARIENYFGFPTGISGQALVGRAFAQAQKFGAEVMIPCEVKRLDCSRADGLLALELEGGARVRARSVVIASGARYRRPSVADLQVYEGKGVWYWASPIEARFCAGQEVIIVGGGNSAGQAAVFLSGAAENVHVMVRGSGLAETMSQYLVDRIAAAPNIALHTRTQLTALEGSPETGLEKVRWRNEEAGLDHERDIRNVFLFIGAEPATAWLSDCGVELDKAGFVITGLPVNSSASPLETSVPGVFAVGDVRSGSVKRVGGAIGEGAQVVAALHGFLTGARQSTA